MYTQKATLLVFSLLFPIFSFAQVLTTSDDVDQLPRFADCSDLSPEFANNDDSPLALLLFHLEDSLLASDNVDRIDGTSEIEFTITAEGEIVDPQIITSPHAELGPELVRLFQEMPNWIPATKAGEPVASSVKLSVKLPLLSNSFMDPFLVMPSFKGCDDVEDRQELKTCREREMLMHIYTNITYPALARENGVEGTVVIQFIVEKDGRINNAQIVREIGGGCGTESLRVVNQMPDWNPGSRFGEPVRVQFNLPVRFKLESGKERKKRRNRN